MATESSEFPEAADRLVTSELDQTSELTQASADGSTTPLPAATELAPQAAAPRATFEPPSTGPPTAPAGGSSWAPNPSPGLGEVTGTVPAGPPPTGSVPSATPSAIPGDSRWSNASVASPTATASPTASQTASPGSGYVPIPDQPPPLYRPSTPPRAGATAAGAMGAVASPPAMAAVPVSAVPSANATTDVQGPRWGWRALVAFLVGGLLTGSGFAVGQLAGDGDSDTVAVGSTTIPTTSVPTTAPSTSPATVRPIDPDADPAAFVAAVLGPSVVQIETELGIGSGVIYDEGLILTNHHVIADADGEVSVLLKDGRRLDGTVLGSDENADIAVVEIEAGLDLPIAELATGEKAQVGQTAIAIGSPFQLQQTVTSGIVSAVDRPVPSANRLTYTAMIQTDAPINPGNSGGALADRQGRVIGINAAIQTDGSTNTNAGVGFAIPIDTALSVADRIVAGIPIESGFLGVLGGPSQNGSAGVEVREVTEGAAADDSGLQVGDLIISIDGAPVTQFEELAGLIVANAPGEMVELEVIRDDETLFLTATLGKRP